MNNLYDALENCLQDIENGADVEAVLLHYSDMADELRPIIQSAVNAKSLSVPNPSADLMRRNRAKLLQRAAEMRAANIEPLPRFVWFNSLRRVAVTLIVFAVLFASGTGLVRAASTTLPGDNLYPVKRTWEGVTLLFTVDLQKRASLEVEHEDKRLQEVHELFANGRSAKVDFAGRVTRQNAGEWLVAGIPVIISTQTELRDPQIMMGDAVRVVGQTQSGGVVWADRVRLLPSGAILPTDGNSGQGSENESSGSGTREESFEGIVDSMAGNLWMINGVSADVSNAEIKGSPAIGAAVKVEGYFNSNGMFIVTKIEFIEGGSNSGSGSNDNDNSGGSADNNNSNDNDNDSSGSGSGGNDNGNDNNSSGPGPGGENDNGNNSGSGSGDENGNDNNSSGPGPGGGGNDNNSGSGSGGDDNANEDNSNSSGGGD